MQVHSVQNNNTNFGNKNTFLNRAKNARNIVERQYWESLHNEAKSKLNYRKFKKTEKELENTDGNFLSFFKVISKMAYRKVLSGIYSGRAYGKFPNRYIGPDNLLAEEERFYKIKKYYN